VKVQEMQDFANRLSGSATYTYFCELQIATPDIRVQRRRFALFLTIKAKIKDVMADLHFDHEKITFYMILRQAMPAFAKAMAL